MSYSMNIELKEKKERVHAVIRVLLYVFLMVFSYIFMVTVRTGYPLPILIVPCALCFSFREKPFGSAVFGMVCGLFTDNACNMLPGINAFLLMWLCLLSSLFVNNLLRRSFFNFLLFDAIITAAAGGLKYLIYYLVPGSDPGGSIFARIFIPEYIYTNISGVVLFAVTAVIAKYLGNVSEHYIEERSGSIVGRE